LSAAGRIFCTSSRSTKEPRDKSLTGRRCLRPPGHWRATGAEEPVTNRSRDGKGDSLESGQTALDLPGGSPMSRWLWGWVILWGTVSPSMSSAGEAPPESWRDDADLHAVQFLDRAIGWAVGDRGTALRTIDGGRNWEARPVPENVSLRAVYFLTDQIGWVAGGGTVPFTGMETGAVFATDDAGVTWRKVHEAPLPRIHALRFFNRTDGIAVGASSADSASGILITSDGGATWSSVPWTAAQPGVGLNRAGWRAAAFVSRGRGVVVGARGRRSIVGDGLVLPSREPSPGLRGLYAVTLVNPLHGWAAGDGGMILRTRDAGLVWDDPPAGLPQWARELFDLRAVAAVDEKVWTAGRPGSLVWHSPDAGRTWRSQPTGTPLPIHALSFTSETVGTAVGAMGLVLRTTDGGTTWQAVRAADRRAALVAIAARPEDLSFPLLATLAGDQGYRSVAVLPIRHDLSAGSVERPTLDLRTHDAVTAAGGNAALTDWPLSLATLGLDRDAEALVAEWNRQSEGKLERVLVGRLVAALRTWRPDVVVLDDPRAGDAASALVHQAATLAIAQAADPTRYAEHAIPPWRVKKAYARRRDEGPADAAIDRDALLSRLGMTASDVADDAAARLGAFEPIVAVREQYRLIPLGDGPSPAGPFFGGLALAPGTAARRAVTEPSNDPGATRLANRQKTFRAYAARAFHDPRQAAGVLAQIDELVVGLTPAQASRQLYLLAESYRRDARWDLAEQTYLALIERYPSEPPSREAMTWLLRLWTGAEPVWRRMKDKGTTTTRQSVDVASLAGRIDKAFQMAAEGRPAVTPAQREAAGLVAEPLQITTERGAVKIDAGRTWDDALVSHWRQQAVRVGGLIRQTDPALFSTPEVQFSLAAAARAGGGSAVTILQRLAANGPDRDWQPAAAAELALARPGGEARAITAICRRTQQPPRLDGVFSDTCWREAKALDLVSPPAATLPSGGLVFLAYDERFLYVAASIPRTPGQAVPTVELAGRTHDADLTGHDRLVVSLDVDRDYVTFYRFAVDHRGQTAEDCWGDASWNPRWFAAVAGDEERWRLELAIPFEELGPRPPTSGTIWAISIARVVPAVGVQGWPRPNEGKPDPEAFSLLRFE
jgi:photosystem II stability/assembly factor-like uncharacterized protein